jgi:glyoxylase-like metal-dependent hydrolase (beta-lactamase superfamily II)
MSYFEQLNNIYCIDGKMRGFDKYMSCYVVKGKKIALVDTGERMRFEQVKAQIEELGIALSDISYIFITHGHQDHVGNAAPLLKEMPNAKVYAHPACKQRLTNPGSIDWKAIFAPEVLARITMEMEPVPEDRIVYLNDGDEFDLGDGEILRIKYTAGHQPTGLVIFESKNNGVFINDLVGNCFLDADSQYILNTRNSDNIVSLETLQEVIKTPPSYLYLGHYGMTDKVSYVLNRAIKQLEDQLEIGRKYASEGKPELIAEKIIEYVMPELEKLRKVRGEEVYRYAACEHIPFQSKIYAGFCEKRFAKLAS